MFNINRFTKEHQEKLKTTNHLFHQYREWIYIDKKVADKLFAQYNNLTDEIIEAESILSKDMIL